MKNYLLYTKKGQIKGSYDEVTDELLEENEALYCIITEEMRQYIIQHLPNIIVNTKKIKDCQSVIDSIDYFELTEPKVNKKVKIKKLIKNIKKTCGEAITQGQEVVLANGDTKKFSYKLEDQINLTDLVSNYNEGDTVSYHASGEMNETYSYEDICTIHKALLNNKIYNQIYTAVLCEWVNNNYDGENIEYGFTNEEIQAEVDEKFSTQKR